MVIGESVYEREHLVPDSRVLYLIYPGKWEAVFWTSVVQVGVINIDSPSSSIFLEQPQHLPTNLGIQIPWWIWLPTTCLPRLGWFFFYLGKGVRPSSGWLSRKVKYWANVRLTMGGCRALQSEPKWRSLYFSEALLWVPLREVALVIWSLLSKRRKSWSGSAVGGSLSTRCCNCYCLITTQKVLFCSL